MNRLGGSRSADAVARLRSGLGGVTKRKKKWAAGKPVVTKHTKNRHEPSGGLKVGGSSRAAPQRVRWRYKKTTKKMGGRNTSRGHADEAPAGTV